MSRTVKMLRDYKFAHEGINVKDYAKDQIVVLNDEDADTFIKAKNAIEVKVESSEEEVVEVKAEKSE